MVGWEKRSARRIPVNCPIRITLPDGQECMGLAHDLSVDGIAFECAIAMPEASAADVQLIPPTGAMTAPLIGAIEVIRCNALDSRRGYLIAAALRVTG